MMEELDLALSCIATDFARKIEMAKEYASQVKAIEDATGLKLLTVSQITYRGRLNVERKDLPAIRKVVGRMEMDGKYLPFDFDTSKEVCVEMKPKSEKFNRIRLMYRTKYKPGKCKVVESVSTTKSLVCGV